MTGHVRVSGTWREVDSMHVRVSGTWREVDQGWTRVSGTWREFYSAGIPIEFVLIAGGGGSVRSNFGQGGGAGGYRSSVIGERSGRDTNALPVFKAKSGTSYTVTIGAGGLDNGNSTGFKGGTSVFATYSCEGGGGAANSVANAAAGGSGGGGGTYSQAVRQGGAGRAGQGFSGATGTSFVGTGSGGGGGAGAETPLNGFGGNGIASSITGTSVYRAGGGNGYNDERSASALGGTAFTGNGVANTGAGGGGGGGRGGSGVAIFRYPSTFSATTVGLTASTSTVGSNKVTIVTAGNGTIRWD